MLVNGKELAQAIEWVTSRLERRREDEYVSLIVDNDGSVFLSRYIATSYFRTPLGASQPFQPVKIHMKASVLQSSVRAIKNQDVIEILQTDSNVVLKSKTVNISVPVSKGVHKTPKEVNVLGEVDAPEFFSTLTKVAVLCETDLPGEHHQLQSVNMIFGKNTITMYGTNRYVIGKATVGYDSRVDNDMKFYIPQEYALMIKSAQAGTGTIEILTEPSSGKVGYRFDDGREALFSTYEVKEGKEYNLESVSSRVSNVQGDEFVLKLREMNEKISIIDSLLPNETKVVVDGNKSELVFRDEDKLNTIMANIESSTDFDNGTRTVTLNRTMVKKALQSIPSDKVLFAMGTEDDKLVRLNPVNENNQARQEFTVGIITVAS